MPGYDCSFMLMPKQFYPSQNQNKYILYCIILYIVLLGLSLIMHKGLKNNFKQIRKQVIQGQPSLNDENVPYNPMHKPSFRGIKKKHGQPLISTNSNQQNMAAGGRMQRVESCRSTFQGSSKKDCNKFSVLIESLGASAASGSSMQKRKS